MLQFEREDKNTFIRNLNLPKLEDTARILPRNVYPYEKERKRSCEEKARAKDINDMYEQGERDGYTSHKPRYIMKNTVELGAKVVAMKASTGTEEGENEMFLEGVNLEN